MSDLFCSRCQSSHRAKARFCTTCKLEFDPGPPSPPKLANNRWVPADHEFAVRIDSHQLKGFLEKNLVVDENQTGLLFRDGSFEKNLNPGKELVKSLPERFTDLISKRLASIVLIRTGQFPITIAGTTLTRDGHEVSFRCEINLILADASSFYKNMFGDKSVVQETDILDRFGPSIRSSLLKVVADCNASELMNLHPELRNRFFDVIETDLTEIANNFGLKVGFISPPEFSSEQLAEFYRKRSRSIHELRDEKLELAVQRARNKIQIESFGLNRILSRAKMRDDLDQLEQDQEFDKAKKVLEHEAKVHDLHLDESLEKVIDQYRQTSRERDRQNRTEDQKDEDAASLRDHLLATVELNRQTELSVLEYDLRKQNIQQDQELDDLERSHRLKAADEEFKAEQERLNLSRDGKIARWKNLQNAQLEIFEKKSRLKLELRLEEIKVDEEESLSDIRVQREQNSADLDKKAGKQELHIKNLKELQEIRQDGKDRDEDREDRRHGRRMDDKQSDQDHELKKMEMDSQKSDMARMAEANPENAALMAEVLKMGMKSGMTADQLEQIEAGSSAAAADALKEKHKASAAQSEQAAQTQKEFYERLLDEVKNAKSMDQQQLTDLIDRIERSGTSGQEFIRDVGVAAARSPANETTSQDAVLKDLTSKLEKLVDSMNKKSDKKD